MRYKEHNVQRTWYGSRKSQHKYIKNKKHKSMFYEVIRWFETWVLILLFGSVSVYIYLIW